MLTVMQSLSHELQNLSRELQSASTINSERYVLICFFLILKKFIDYLMTSAKTSVDVIKLIHRLKSAALLQKRFFVESDMSSTHFASSRIAEEVIPIAPASIISTPCFLSVGDLESECGSL
jgi:hypothetical protein